jgi:hypothetical protein
MDEVKPLFADLVRRELIDARNQHGAYQSAHEALAVIWEEFDEFKREVFRKAHMRDKGQMLRELVQVAVTCQRAAEDLGLIPR